VRRLNLVKGFGEAGMIDMIESQAMQSFAAEKSLISSSFRGHESELGD
jgi:hypothetical protein